MEAGFGVISVFLNCDTDGFLPATYPLYLGTILTPERPPRTIVIEFQDHTWHLYQLYEHRMKSFSSSTLTIHLRLCVVTTKHCRIEHSRCRHVVALRSGSTQIRAHAHSPETSSILHESGGDRNARDTFRDLEAAGYQFAT
jgi:hypothetical protein